MSDGEYAEMIEIPVSTCEMVVLPKKRKKRNLRKKVIERVNKNLEIEETTSQSNCERFFENSESTSKQPRATTSEKRERKAFKLDVISVQVCVIFALIVAILVTNIFWEDSGMNTLLKSVFKSEQAEKQIDAREYNSFTVCSPTKANEVQVEEGIMTIASSGAVYSPCSGIVDNIAENNGKYTITINHSDMFKTIIRNADYAYFNVGETVYQAVPVCYSSEGGAQVLMYNNNTLLTNYSVADGSIIWQS